MGNFFNNGAHILKLTIRVCIYHIYKYTSSKKCWFENWIFNL